MIKLDYTIDSPEERKKLVEKILEENPEPNEKFLETLADYLILCMEKQERKQKKILTDNRMATVNKRETSFEGLVSQFENGEDGIYSLINEDKNTIFKPKLTITKKDLEEIPPLKQIREAIAFWEKKLKKVSGRQAYIAKKTIIDLRKEQYMVKESWLGGYIRASQYNMSNSNISFDEIITVDEDGNISAEGVSLLNPKVCSAILCNYSKLKQDSYGEFDKDLWYLMQNFDDISYSVLKKYPLYLRLVEYKIDGLQNAEIQLKLQEEFGINHSIEYISSLWRKKIPNLIASAAEDEFLNWYYLNEEKGKYKKCSRCGKIKLAHNKYFSINKTSKDGFYSICKECRNAKGKKVKSNTVKNDSSIKEE